MQHSGLSSNANHMSILAEYQSMVLGAINQIPRQADIHCKVMNEII